METDANYRIELSGLFVLMRDKAIRPAWQELFLAESTKIEIDRQTSESLIHYDATGVAR
jgi:hypothetical protein